jgi:O-antigen/teichoic acid export membrane protein
LRAPARAGNVLSRTAGPLLRLLSAEAVERLVTMGGSRALAAVLGFVATILIARALEPTTLGLWSMALAVQGLAVHLAEAGLRSVAVAEVARTPSLAGVYVRRIVVLRLLISTAVITAAGLVARRWSLGDWPITCLVLSSLWPIALQLDWLPLAQGRNRLAAVLLLARTTAFCLLLVIVPLAGDPLRLAVLFVAAWWVAAVVTWPCLGLMPDRPPVREDALGLLRLLRLALPIAFGTFASQVLLGLDILLVGARFGPAAAAFYYLASAILVAGLVLANGLGQTALARMATRTAEPAAFRTALGADLRLVISLALILAVTAASLAPFLLPLAFGPAYAAATALLLWLLPWFVLTQATTVLQAAMAAGRLGDWLVVANSWLLGTHVVALGVAWWLSDLRAFALARGMAELVRLVVLWRLLPAPLRPSDQLLPFKSAPRA